MASNLEGNPNLEAPSYSHPPPNNSNNNISSEPTTHHPSQRQRCTKLFRRIMCSFGFSEEENSFATPSPPILMRTVSSSHNIRRTNSTPNLGRTFSEELVTRTSTEIEAVVLLLHLQRSSLTVQLRQGKHYLAFTVDGLCPFKVELIESGKSLASQSFNQVACQRHHIEFPITIHKDLNQLELKLTTLVSASMQFSEEGRGKMISAAQTNLIAIECSKGNVANPEPQVEARVSSQKIKIGDMMLSLYEIYGQPTAKTLVGSLGFQGPASHISVPMGHSPSMPSLYISPTGSLSNEQDGIISKDNMSESFWVNRECVVCLSQARDTLFLPCRHMCLCVECAETVSTNSDKCPICRQEYSSLLNITRIPSGSYQE